MTNDMHRQPAQTPPKSMLEEYAAELTPTPGELAATLGPAQRRPAAAEARKTPEEAPATRNLEMVMRIPVTVKIVLGSATMPVANLMKLGRGAVIPLDRKVGEPVDMVVNGRVVARGEVVVVDEGSSRFGIKLTEVVGPSDTDKPA
jgi:flagellar motor switch protein FliN/FliY